MLFRFTPDDKKPFGFTAGDLPPVPPGTGRQEPPEKPASGISSPGRHPPGPVIEPRGYMIEPHGFRQYITPGFHPLRTRTGADDPMRMLAAGVHQRKGARKPESDVGALIRRVEGLMSDERYPPLYQLKATIRTPFLIKYPRP
jgi:hypothetical protein